MSKGKEASLAEVTDEYYKVQQERRELDKKSKELKERETNLKNYIADFLRKNKMSAVGGTHIIATYVRKPKAIAENWSTLYDFIVQNEAFDILQRRLHEGAIKDRLEQGESIPGLGTIWIDDISVSKVKK
jgi:hypothetical protein